MLGFAAIFILLLFVLAAKVKQNIESLFKFCSKSFLFSFF
ncbi:hypothetical protein [uncultured Bacteroides sp.]